MSSLRAAAIPNKHIEWTLSGLPIWSIEANRDLVYPDPNDAVPIPASGVHEWSRNRVFSLEVSFQGPGHM
jgi:hypothetical protein